MSDRDPLRDHIARPPRAPRIERGRDPGPETQRSWRPAMDAVSRVLTEGRRATPVGIGIGIATPLVLVFAALFATLGREGLVDVAAAWRSSSAADRALAGEVAALRADLAVYSRRVEQTQRAHAALETNAHMLCDLVSELNHGKPHESWCAPDGRSIKFSAPSLGAITPYHITAARFRRMDEQ